MNKKIPVELMFDTANETWNVMTLDRQCLEYGSIDHVETWLKDHEDTHFDVDAR